MLLAWLDGPSIDDGTACEIGMFAELVTPQRRYADDPLGISGVLLVMRPHAQDLYEACVDDDFVDQSMPEVDAARKSAAEVTHELLERR